MKKSVTMHKHTWMVTTVAIILAIAFLVLLPQNKSYSMLFMGIAGGHLVIALIAIFTGWMLVPQNILDKLMKKRVVEGFDFGWAPKWIYGFLAASIVMFIIAVHVFISLAEWPIAQLVIYTILLLIAINFFIANAIIRNSNRTAKLTLPMIDILANGGNKILDAGCGSGRTTIAIAEAIPNANIIAFDKFDADYIDEGGNALLRKNIQLAGIENRVIIEKGDILKTAFNNNQFDAIVSSFMIDHLRTGKKQALKETFRIMKPGSRFLLLIIVRGYTAFGIASVLSLFLTSRKTWIDWIEQTGFTMVSDGRINEGAYFCFEKPSNSK